MDIALIIIFSWLRTALKRVSNKTTIQKVREQRRVVTITGERQRTSVCEFVINARHLVFSSNLQRCYANV